MEAGRDDLARVYIAETAEGRAIEFVESLQPPIPREEKWVLIVSTLYGCPIGCRFCDAGGNYRGPLSADEIFFQIEYLLNRRYPDGAIPVKKLKIQFARMGEPAFNRHVIEVLDHLPERYAIPGLLPSLSTVAPEGRDDFFEALLEVKRRHYAGRFQLQFSLHSTDEAARSRLIPARTWSFAKMAEYGESFYEKGDRKIVLNFALADGIPFDPDRLLAHFPPNIFMVKVTPVNPTYRAAENRITSSVLRHRTGDGLLDGLRTAGYDALLSIGEWEENRIGSNCGQYLFAHRRREEGMIDGYTYDLRAI